MMLLIRQKHHDDKYHVTGVDRLFLAPELYMKHDESELNDVWSIGAILYLLITGGLSEKKNEETFDFREQ